MAISFRSQSFTLFLILLLTCTEVAVAVSLTRKAYPFTVFNESSRDSLEFSGSNSTIYKGALQLTTDTADSKFLDHFYNNSGRIMYHQPFRIHNGRIMGSFNSTFVINLNRDSEWEAGHGLTFLIAPNVTLPESSHGQWLGLTNSTTDGSKDNHIVAIEFSTENQDNRLGLNINSAISNTSVSLTKSNISMSSIGAPSYQVWVQYNAVSQLMQVYMAEEKAAKPPKPILSQKINLKDYVKEESYFGFSASTGFPKIQLNCVLSWTLEIEFLEKEKDLKWRKIAAGVGIPTLTLLLVLSIMFCVRKRRRMRRRIEEANEEFGNLRFLPGMPREFKYKELKGATNNFDESMKLGEGGFGIVYKGTVPDHNNIPCEIAVKKFTRDNIKSKDDFLAELTIIHRLRHKHLVRLVGKNHYSSMFSILMEIF